MLVNVELDDDDLLGILGWMPDGASAVPAWRTTLQLHPYLVSDLNKFRITARNLMSYIAYHLLDFSDTSLASPALRWHK